MQAQPAAALLLIDLQKAIDAPYWALEGPRNNPQAEAVAARLLAHWRDHARPVVHVRHDSTDPASSYRPGQSLHGFKPEVEPRAGEVIIAKTGRSAFVGTGLEDRLRALGVTDLCVIGVCTNNSVEATVRHGADLGFHIALVEDACFTYARRAGDGRLLSAEAVHEMSLSNIHGEYGVVVRSAQVLG